ncbi:zinc finger and SCAN domain-containing protein 22 [Delphinapterus leucas]|uniref:Zinc finger and SCAN domain-containing protein 22 n=1 Tax=Delphinapterus leucas TaxID=9749 RepID=A0A7F8K8T7_DELLE|nr:zinc finger and SCAN domain-containing protein 22 [Delphinapterus leucas]
MESEGLTPSRAWTDRRTDRVWSSVPVRDRLTDQLYPVPRLQPFHISLEVCCPMAIPKSLVSPVPWEQDDFLRVKVEHEEASFSQVQESNFGHTSHPEAARLCF